MTTHVLRFRVLLFALAFSLSFMTEGKALQISQHVGMGK